MSSEAVQGEPCHELPVPIDNIAFVEVVESQGDFRGIEANPLFGESAAFALEILEELAAGLVVHDQICVLELPRVRSRGGMHAKTGTRWVGLFTELRIGLERELEADEKG
jgi:hypothetical protein